MSSPGEPAARARFRVLPGGRAASPEAGSGQPPSGERGPFEPDSRLTSEQPYASPSTTDGDHSGTEGVEPAQAADLIEAAEAAEPPPPADFRVRCPECGPQYVAIADVRFISTGGDADTDRYLFTCPACGLRVRRPAGPELARILKSAGVATLALRRGPDQAL